MPASRGIVALAVAASLSSACSASILIGARDRTFERSQARLSRTLAAVQAAGAGPADAALFIQAESLYRYRFAPPPRGFGAYLAQAAAVAVDFPALQALAGTLNLFALRLRMNDGAVQLWETLLARSPASPLRPLVLYRLGWAYRNVIAPGFPRADPDQPFVELERAFPASPLVDLAREARGVAWKSHGAATAWSVVPGLGQMYVGEYGGGGARLAVALAAAAMILAPAYAAYRERDDLSWRDDWDLLAVGLAGITILSIDYTLAYEDALRGVTEHNERMEAAFEASHPAAP